MRTIPAIMRLALLLATIMVASGGLAPRAAAQDAEELLVKFRPGTPGAERASLHHMAGAHVFATLGSLGVERVSGPRGMDAVYRHNPNVVYVEPNSYRPLDQNPPNDPWYGVQWNMPDVGAPAAWSLLGTSPGPIVAVVDTGIDRSHADLAGRIMVGASFVDYTSNVDDDHGHGTEVSGIIAAVTNNGIGVAGLASATIMPLKACGFDGSCGDGQVAQAILYATDNGARIINLSLGAPGWSQTQSDAVAYARAHGVTVAAASGNNGTLGVLYPAAYPGVLAVGASAADDSRSALSNYGPELSVLAPGNGIYTTMRGSLYGSFSGTSFAAPHVAGEAAVLLTLNPSLTVDQIEQLVDQTATDGGWTEERGWGRIDVGLAAARAGGVATQVLPTATALPTLPPLPPTPTWTVPPTATPRPTATPTPRPACKPAWKCAR